MANKTGNGTFKQGDPRINRNGRPKSFDALRSLAQAISHEIAKSSGGTEMVVDGHKVTVVEAIMRQWAQSKNPQLQRTFIEVGFGKVPETIEVTGKDGKPLAIKWVDVEGADD